MAYITPPTNTSPIDLALSAFEYIQTYFPQWTPNAGALATILVQANAEVAADVKDTSSRVPQEIFKYYGQSVVNLLPVAEAPATVSSTWKMTDTLGHSITSGTVVYVRNDFGEFIGFVVVGGPYVIAPGSNTTAVGAVALVAVLPGEEGNGLSSTHEVTPEDQLAYVDTITLVGTSTNGADAETEEDYLGRLVTELRLQSPRPLLPSDFAVLARRIAGVDRAVAVDNWDPVSGTGFHERTTCIFAVDSAGIGVSAGIKTSIKTYLESLRGENFVINVGDPTYTPVSAAYDIAILPGSSRDLVLTASQDAVREYLRSEEH